MSRLQQKIRENLITVISVFSILIIWELLSFLFSSNLILPAPQVVFWETYKLIISTGFFKHISLTILRGLSGLIISFGLSILIGIPAGINNTVFRFFRPYLVLLRSIPVISFILLALIWLKPQHVPVFIAILTMFPILTFSMIEL